MYEYWPVYKYEYLTMPYEMLFVVLMLNYAIEQVVEFVAIFEFLWMETHIANQ